MKSQFDSQMRWRLFITASQSTVRSIHPSIKQKLWEGVVPREWSGRDIKLTTQLHTMARLWTHGAVSPLHQHFRLKGELHATHLYNQYNPVQSTPDTASPSQTSSVCEQILSYNAFRFNAAFDKSSPPTCRHKLRRANSDAVSGFECILFDSSVSTPHAAISANPVDWTWSY